MICLLETGIGQDDRDDPAYCNDSITFVPVMRLRILLMSFLRCCENSFAISDRQSDLLKHLCIQAQMSEAKKPKRVKQPFDVSDGEVLGRF